jgi:hypothetical protein
MAWHGMAWHGISITHYTAPHVQSVVLFCDNALLYFWFFTIAREEEDPTKNKQQ